MLTVGSENVGVIESSRSESTQHPNRRHVLRMVGVGAIGLSALAGCASIGNADQPASSPTTDERQADSPRKATDTDAAQGTTEAEIGSSGGTDTGTPTTTVEANSYERLTGTWCGINVESNWLRFEFRAAIVEPGEELGYAWDLESKGGELFCRGPMFGLRSEPPDYGANVKVTAGGCKDGEFKFKHRPEDGELLFWWKPAGRERFSYSATLEQTNCKT